MVTANSTRKKPQDTRISGLLALYFLEEAPFFFRVPRPCALLD